MNKNNPECEYCYSVSATYVDENNGTLYCTACAEQHLAETPQDQDTFLVPVEVCPDCGTEECSPECGNEQANREEF